MSRVRAHQLIEAAQVVENLSLLTVVNKLPATERQARPLATLTPPEQVEAWQAVIEMAGAGKTRDAESPAS